MKCAREDKDHELKVHGPWAQSAGPREYEKCAHKDIDNELKVLVLASTISVLARTSTMPSMCLSSRFNTTKLRSTPRRSNATKLHTCHCFLLSLDSRLAFFASAPYNFLKFPLTTETTVSPGNLTGFLTFSFWLGQARWIVDSRLTIYASAFWAHGGCPRKHKHNELKVLVLASTNSALAKTSTMRSMCLSSRCDATKLRPIPPKIQRSKASYVSLSSLWFFFFFVRPGPHPIPKDRQVNDSTLSQPRVNATEIHTQPTLSKKTLKIQWSTFSQKVKIT